MKALEDIEINLDYIESGLKLRITARKEDTCFDASDSFYENNEAQFQIVEGHFYDYALTSPKYELGDIGQNIIQPQKHLRHIGRISPNIFVGTLEIPILRIEDLKQYEPVKLEVQSIKSSYRDDYRTMLEFITEQCTDLLLQANSPSAHTFETDYEKDNQTLYQRFAFVKSIISSIEFDDAIHRIIRAPVTKWSEIDEQKDIRGVRRFSNRNIKELLRGGKRTVLPQGHFLEQNGFKTLPEKITSTQKIDSVDTPENRFIKHALETFLQCCLDINKASSKNSRLDSDSIQLINKLESYLHHSIFQEILKPTTLKLNSPVLQRKEGYREVLRVWLMFDLAAKLIWQGGEDVYGAGKKDIATLYEYWLFFKLLDSFKKLFKIEPKGISDLIKETNDGLSLQIKQGKFTPLSGVYESKNRKLQICFSYNRSFSGQKTYPDSGSWSVAMRPDYTLSFWPFGISDDEAEKQELITHIHFDAKYKVANLFNIDNHAEINLEQEILSKEQEILSKEKEENRRGIYKNADLLKMHAYKDAIRRTSGAYVLYPGDKSINRKGFRELIPGLGAFPVRPSKYNSGIDELELFIEEVLHHFDDRASQREKIAYRTYDIYKEKKKEDEVRESLPEVYGENRDLIPDDTYILVGFYKQENLNWIESRGLYNTRTGTSRGTLRLGIGETSAKYLLLHTGGETKTSRLLKIIGEGPRVFSKEALIKKDYPTNPSQDYYLVYEVQNSVDEELQNYKWDITKLSKYTSGRGSGLPFSVTLSELMKVKIDE